MSARACVCVCVCASVGEKRFSFLVSHVTMAVLRCADGMVYAIKISRKKIAGLASE